MNIMKKAQAGFTLIELMIVVAIIGILAAVAIPQYQDYILKAKLSKVATAIDPVKLAIAQFRQENGAFPAALASGGDWSTIGLSTTQTITTTEIASVDVLVNGVIQVTLATGLRATGVDGKMIKVTPDVSDGVNMKWTATAGATPITDATALAIIAKWH